MALDDEDHDLLERWRRGDGTAGDQLFKRHFGAVFRFFRNKVGAEAQDLTQRTFLKCVEKRDLIDQRGSVRAYLLGIARYELFNHLRRRKKSDRIDPGVTSIAATGYSPSTAWARKQSQKQLLVALTRLPLDTQVLLELHYWEKMPAAQMAGVLEVPVGTIKSRLRRARERVLEAMQAQDVVEDAREVTTERIEAWAKELADLDADPEAV